MSAKTKQTKHCYFSTSFWDDEWVCSLKPLEKMLYVYLLTNPLINIAGVYKITERRILFDTGLSKKQVQEFMKKYQEDHKAFRMGEYIVIPSAPKHQQWETSDKIYKGIVNLLEEIGPDNLRLLVRMDYKFPLKVVFDRLQIPLKPVSIPHEGVLSLSDKSPVETVLERSAESGFFIEADVAARLVSTIDPTWIDGPHNFMKLAAERARGGRYADLSEDEQKAIYISALLKWDDLRQEYPVWRENQEKNERLEALRIERERIKNTPPKTCQCGAKLGPDLRCPVCERVCYFDDEQWRWAFIERQNISLTGGFMDHLKSRMVDQ
jgi:hypothetical protein